jgi:YD repeat-containing protein
MTGPHALLSTTNYSYAQGLYDFPTREFRGFGQVTETRADSSKVIHYYYQDEAKKGKEYKTETKNSSDAPFVSVQNTFSEALSNGVYTSNITQTDEYTFDGVATNPKLKRTEYQNYDSYGNVGLLINYGDTGVSGDETYTYNEYWPGCSSVYVVDRLKHKYIKPSAAGSTLREGFYWYDNGTSCVSKGNLTKEENWLNTGGNPITLYEYDSYGNRNKTTDPEGRVTRLEFDSMYHSFPVNSYNAKNQLTTRSFNVVNGEVIQEIDPNGFTTTYVYDTFQRKIREVKPYDSDASPTVAIEYRLDGIPPESVIVYRKDGTPTYDTVQFMDGFGNLIQTKAEYESNMNKTVADVFYDEMGRVKKQSNPYLTDSTLAYSLPDVLAPGTGYTYDPLGRPIQIQNPDGTQINRTFDHWTVNETDENGHAKSYTFDASQRLKQVVENNSGSSYVTNYVYSPLGELNTITDHLGNVTTIRYDSLGQKTSLTDPDMGTWSYRYDRVGNLTSQTDARGITTRIDYDPLNRKAYIYYPNDTYMFAYDYWTIGTLWIVASGSGTPGYHGVTYEYDQRLRKIQERVEMEDPSMQRIIFWTTRWSYDSMDRVTSQTYPDGQTVTFNYNAQGKLDNIPGIITGIDYNASGQVTQKNYANGKSTTYAYHPSNLRLTSLATSGIQNFTYTYDNVGNIKSIADGISGKIENYGYDDLDRLTGAGDGTYGIQYQYNPIGNMLSMTKNSKLTQFTYGAGAAIPHAVTGMTIPIPVVGSFVINKGDAYTTTNVVTLENISAGNPTYYMASEVKTFAGAAWQTYSTAPSFLLSAGFGIKTVYFKVMNMEGESAVKSDTIELMQAPDNIPPTSTITIPANGSTFFASIITIHGTASDGTGSGVEKVEVSTDGGSTWNLATGTTWSYTWTIPGVGTYNIKSRATDNAGNVEASGAGITVTLVQRQPSTVTVNGRQLLVNGNPFTIKGVGYSSVPIGVDPEITPPYGDYFTSDQKSIYDRDLPLLRDMGANTIRLWGWNNTADHLDFLDKAYNGGVNQIYVIAGFWINSGLDIDPNLPDNMREQIKTDFKEMVSIHKNHPAILMWAIGNELNAPWMYGSNLDNLFSLINEMAFEAHAEEGSNYHPVTTPLADINLVNTITTYNASVSFLDVWGTNVYRGNTFANLFNDYKAVSAKPFVILEYGIDAYDNAHGNEYEKLGTPYQADYAEALWEEIAANSDTCIGSSIMEYSDEWWKGKYGSGSGCPDNNPAFHGTCGYATTSHPDGYSNEEWWGIMRTKDNGDAPDIMETKAGYYRLQILWIPQYTLTVSKTGTGSGTVTSSDGKISCGSDCSETYSTVTEVTLTAAPTAGSTFASWSGCTPTPTDPKKCTVTVSDNTTVTATFQKDTNPPTGSIIINSGAEATKSKSVTLTLTASDDSGGAIQMCISNTNSCTRWTAFAATKSWSLTKGSATKTVYVWFKDRWGNANAMPYSDTIILDTTAPVKGTVTGTPGNTQVTLNWSGFSDALSGIGSYKVVYSTRSAPRSCSRGTTIYTGSDTSYPHTGLINGTTYGYRVCAIDKAGNMSLGATTSARPVP